MVSRIVALTLLAVLLLPAAAAFAQPLDAAEGMAAEAGIIAQATVTPFSGKSIALFAGTLSIALIVLAAAKGIGTIGSHAVDAIARQPEAAGDIRNNMIVAAALIEGVALVGAILCILPLFVFN